MPYDFQVAIDCADPHALADWWAETLEWEVESPADGFVQSMIDKGYATEDQTIVHKGVLTWRTGAAIRHPEAFPSGNPRRVIFQIVPEAKTVKNRIHLDMFVGKEARDALRDKLVARGATFLRSGQQGPLSWYTMADIEGNEFCVN
jgi:hypothetical protein